MRDTSETRLSGALILAGVLGAVVLMLHHPTSLNGPDDGHLLRDWTNTAVHGGMIVCLLLLRLGVSDWAGRLGRQHLSVRAGAMAFDIGMAAFVAAALVNGFAAPGLIARVDPAVVGPPLAAFGALNHALADLGMVLTAAAMALWAVRMTREDLLTRLAGILGLAVAAAAAGWLILGRGVFGLYPATVATVLFAAWSILVASRMMRDGSRGEER